MNWPLLIGWLEQIVKDYNRADQAAKSISNTFARAGQDIYNHNEGLYQLYLDSLSEQGLYKSLNEAQAIAPIDELNVDAPAPLEPGTEEGDGEGGSNEWKTCDLCCKYRMMTREWFERFSVCAVICSVLFESSILRLNITQ